MKRSSSTMKQVSLFSEKIKSPFIDFDFDTQSGCNDGAF